MYIVDGIAYAGEPAKLLHVCGVRPLDGHKLWVKFDTGEARVFDFTPFLKYPCYKPLMDEKLFKEVYIDYGTAVWNDGEIDIAPEQLYNAGVEPDTGRQKDNADIEISGYRAKSVDD